MPKETPQRPKQGPGSIAPSFTPPTTQVATPSFAQREQPSEFSKFRDAIVASGKGAASIAAARSNVAVRMKAIKAQGVAETEKLIQRQDRQFQLQRKAESEQTRRAILMEAEKKGPDWVERQFRSRMVNAGSAEEALFWEGAWRPAAGAVKRENAEQFRQEFNSAVRSVDQIATTLALEVQADPNTKAVLIGDGENIANRVQNWMMLKVNEAQPGVFDLEEGSTEDQARTRDMLVHQLMMQSAKMADNLIDEHNGRVEKSKQIVGTQQLEADLYSTLTGQQDPNATTAQVEATLEASFGHLTIDQQRGQVRAMVSASLTALGSGSYGIDALNKIGTATSLLNMELDGEPVFSPAERQRAATDLLVQAEKTAKREMESEVGRIREGLTEVVTLPNGTTVFRPDPNADALMSTPDPDTGLTPIDDAANRVLAEMGLLGATNLNPEGQRIVNSVRQAAARAGAASLAKRVKAATAIANHDTVLTGEPGGNPNDAHDMSMFTRAHKSGRALTASDTPPLGAREIDRFKSQLVPVAEGLGIDADVVNSWDGSTVEYNDENRDLNKVMATAEALQWSNQDTQAQYGIPTDLAADKLALLRSNDPNRLEAFTEWAKNLTAGANEGWDNFLSAEGVSSQEAAAAQWARVNARQGRPRINAAGDVFPGEFPDDPAVMLAEVQAILKSRPVNGWLGADTGQEDVDRSNVANMAEALAAVVKDQVKLESDADDRFGSKIIAQFQRLFLSDTDHTGRFVRNLWFAGRAAEPDLNDGQLASMVWTWLRGDGYRWREINDRQVLVIDPQGYTGAEGASIQGHVDLHMNMKFSPLYRSFLMEAMDLEPSEVPHNMAGMFLIGTGRDPLIPGSPAIRGKWEMSDQTTDRLLESRANYGGFFVEGRDFNGNPLPVPIAKQDTLMRWPDGSTFMVPKGTVLSVINPDLFAPEFRLPKAPRSTVLQTPANAPAFARPGTARPQF